MAKKKSAVAPREVRKVTINSKSVSRTERPDLPSIWVDFARTLVRDEPAVMTVRFYTILPEGMTETVRLQMPTVFAKKLVEQMSRMLDHYPEKEQSSELGSP